MAEAIKTKVLLKKPDGTSLTADRILLALTENEALSLLIVCGGIGGSSEGRRGHFTGLGPSIYNALHNTGVNLPEKDGGYDYKDYYEGQIDFKDGV